jgi:hypothetical protein
MTKRFEANPFCTTSKNFARLLEHSRKNPASGGPRLGSSAVRVGSGFSWMKAGGQSRDKKPSG